MVDVHNVAACWIARRWQSYRAFVNAWYPIKRKAPEGSPQKLHAKLILNSAYGKFGSNPENYFDYALYRPGDDHRAAPWEPYVDYGGSMLLRRPSARNAFSFYDVAIAASITGAARCVLLRGLSRAHRPVYCDTDSIICERLGLPKHATRLGAWKLEAEGDTIAIASKKIYSLRCGKKEVKQAAKGCTLSSREIFAIARGKIVEYHNPAPTFSLSRPRGDFFVTRKISRKGTP
jgi:hypothetical protein